MLPNILLHCLWRVVAWGSWVTGAGGSLPPGVTSRQHSPGSLCIHRTHFSEGFMQNKEPLTLIVRGKCSRQQLCKSCQLVSCAGQVPLHHYIHLTGEWDHLLLITHTNIILKSETEKRNHFDTIILQSGVLRWELWNSKVNNKLFLDIQTCKT